MFQENESLENSILSGENAARVLFFDFEWVPNSALLESIAHHYAIERSRYDSLASPDTCVSSMTVADFKDYISDRRPTAEWIEEAIDVAKKLKGKKTAEEALVKELERVNQGNIPSDVLSMAECQTIVTMSWALGYNEVQQMAGDEKAICEKLAEIMLLNVKPAGWAIRTSDIPAFLAACARHKVDPRRSFDLRYGSDILDMYEIRFGRGAKGKLTDVAFATGFESPQPDPLKDGSEVAIKWMQGRVDEILLHNKIDILKLQHLHKHYAGIYW